MLAVGATDDNRTEGSVTRKVGEALHRVDPTRVVAMDLMQVSVKDSENYTVKWDEISSIAGGHGRLGPEVRSHNR